MQKLKGQEDTIMSEAKNPPKYGPKMWKVKSQGRVWGGKEGQKEVGGQEGGNWRSSRGQKNIKAKMGWKAE